MSEKLWDNIGSSFHAITKTMTMNVCREITIVYSTKNMHMRDSNENKLRNFWNISPAYVPRTFSSSSPSHEQTIDSHPIREVEGKFHKLNLVLITSFLLRFQQKIKMEFVNFSIFPGASTKSH